MKTIPHSFSFILLLILAATITFCRKNTDYPKGGNTKQAMDNLYAEGGVWYAQRYEVDGADSTAVAFPATDDAMLTRKFVFSINKEKTEHNRTDKVKACQYWSPFLFNWERTQIEVKGCSYQCPCVRSYTNAPRPLCLPGEKMKLVESIFWDIETITPTEFIITTQRNRTYRLVFGRGLMDL